MSGGLTDPNLLHEQQNSLKHVWMIGRVVDNNDPLKLKRVKVSIPDVVEGSGDQIPWAIPVTSDFESVHIPPVGKVVYCLLQNGDIHYPMYLGEATTSSNPISSVLATNYPNRYGTADDHGNYWYVDKQTGEIKFNHHSGTQITIDNSGNATISVVGNITSSATTWNHTGDINVTGQVTATVEVIGNGVKLSHHQHNGVRNGDSLTGPPQNF